MQTQKLEDILGWDYIGSDARQNDDAPFPWVLSSHYNIIIRQTTLRVYV